MTSEFESFGLNESRLARAQHCFAGFSGGQRITEGQEANFRTFSVELELQRVHVLLGAGTTCGAGDCDTVLEHIEAQLTALPVGTLDVCEGVDVTGELTGDCVHVCDSVFDDAILHVFANMSTWLVLLTLSDGIRWIMHGLKARA